MGIKPIYIYIFIGFFSQIIDGSFGMAYGVCSTTFLSILGTPIKIASISVHISEIFTSFVSGITHWKAQNIDWLLLKLLVISGIIGGGIGAYTLVKIPENIISPIISIYLLIMSGALIFTTSYKVQNRIIKGRIILIGLAGGFLDAIGGGGWGVIVTSTLLVYGCVPRYTIGTVNTVEFFVTLIQIFTFSKLDSLTENVEITVGLTLGGIVATPFSALICKNISGEKITTVIALLLILLNIKYFFSYIL